MSLHYPSFPDSDDEQTRVPRTVHGINARTTTDLIFPASDDEQTSKPSTVRGTHGRTTADDAPRRSFTDDVVVINGRLTVIAADDPGGQTPTPGAQRRRWNLEINARRTSETGIIQVMQTQPHTTQASQQNLEHVPDQGAAYGHGTAVRRMRHGRQNAQLDSSQASVAWQPSFEEQLQNVTVQVQQLTARLLQLDNFLSAQGTENEHPSTDNSRASTFHTPTEENNPRLKRRAFSRRCSQY